MTPELMRRFLAEVRAGEIRRTETVIELEGEFLLALTSMGRGRGRPKVDRDSVGWLRQSLHGGKGTHGDVLDFLAKQLAKGALQAEALKVTAARFGRTMKWARIELGHFGGWSGVEQLRQARAKLAPRKK